MQVSNRCHLGHLLATFLHRSSTIRQATSLHVRERLRTHKVFTKYQCFYHNYHKFSIKSYVLDVY